jgi:hypothetical protein
MRPPNRAEIARSNYAPNLCHLNLKIHFDWLCCPAIVGGRFVSPARHCGGFGLPLGESTVRKIVGYSSRCAPWAIVFFVSLAPVFADSPTTRPSTQPSVASQFKPYGVRKLLPTDNGLGISSPPVDANQQNYYPSPDRWAVGFPGDYAQNSRNDTIFDPYDLNVLKGDYPILGQDKFMILSLTSDTLYQASKLPAASGISAERPNSFEFFGQGDQQFIREDLIESVDFFEGDADYRPRDWDIKETGVFEYNNIQTNEFGEVNPDVRYQDTRNTQHFGFQELFGEYRLASVSPNFDIMSVRVGIQEFNNDFRGFLFDDSEPGVRVFGNLASNQIQYNVAAFYMLEKNTDTGLNTFTRRDQGVILANLYHQDFIFPGYTAQISGAANFDNPETAYDENGVIARPEPIGAIQEKAVRAYYLGWAGDGHIGRFDVTHQFYQALGEESYNAIAERKTEIDAQFGAVEVAYDSDYWRYHAAFVYASGDHDASDGKATGFDSIFDNPNFLGGGFDLWTQQSIALLNTKVALKGNQTLLPDLRTSKEEGQANFVNPGLIAYNLGAECEVTPTVTLIGNVSYLTFDSTNVLQEVEHDNRIASDDLSIDYSLGVRWRPLLSNNIIVTAGGLFLTPLAGFKEIYQSDTLYDAFVRLTLTY